MSQGIMEEVLIETLQTLDIKRQGYYFRLNMEDFKDDPSKDMVSLCSNA